MTIRGSTLFAWAAGNEAIPYPIPTRALPKLTHAAAVSPGQHRQAQYPLLRYLHPWALPPMNNFPIFDFPQHPMASPVRCDCGGAVKSAEAAVTCSLKLLPLPPAACRRGHEAVANPLSACRRGHEAVATVPPARRRLPPPPRRLRLRRRLRFHRRSLRRRLRYHCRRDRRPPFLRDRGPPRARPPSLPSRAAPPPPRVRARPTRSAHARTPAWFCRVST
jgi:hypothetical protein